MKEKVELIWDFRGPNAAGIARHHAVHLEDFARMEGLEHFQCGTREQSAMHHIAFMVVDIGLLDLIRKRLKPNRGRRLTD